MRHHSMGLSHEEGPQEIFMDTAVRASTFENIIYEKKGTIAYITLNRPKVLNALNQATFTELGVAFERAGADTAVMGVILTGAGDKAFIAGAGISELAHVTAVEAREFTRRGHTV